MIMQALRNTRPRPHSSDPALPVTGRGTHDLQEGLQAQERTVLTCRRLPGTEPARCGPGKTHQEGIKPLNARLAQPPEAPASPTEIPQVRVLEPPHRYPTDKTAFRGTPRHSW